MTSFLRGKQAGIQRDLSAGLDASLLTIDEVIRYGINSQVSTLAYDPVQSLLAVGTKDTKFGSGQIYVFGQKRVSTVFNLPRKASVRILQFCADKLVCVDSKNDLSVYSLETTRILGSYAPPGLITALVTDPTLDFGLVGLQNGEIIAYDLDRLNLAPLRIPNLWRDRNPRARLLPVVSLAFHPRDIGSLLIGYSEGAVTYSFKSDGPKNYFHYQLPAGAPGGDSEANPASQPRYPKLSQALWHPTGTFILISYEDSSFVIWDPKDARIILARTLQACNVNQPGAASGIAGSGPGTFAIKEPLFRVAWCSKENPDDTGILVAGGFSTAEPSKGLTFMDLGPTPNYATSSWQALSGHFESPKRQHLLATPPNAEVVDFCLIPRKSPHFAGASDPIAVLAILASGEIITLSFPSGHPINPANQLHVSLTYVHPFVNRIEMAFVDRTKWLGMVENRSQGPPLLKGGAEARHPIMRFANRNILQAAHADGTVRIWDAGHGDEIENGAVLHVDVARAIGRYENIDIDLMSMSNATGELAVGLRTGEVAVFRWARNADFGRDVPHKASKAFDLEKIVDRAEPGVKEGLLPFTLLEQQQGPTTALKMSDVGFICAGFGGGSLVVIDLRGPATIYDASVSDVNSQANKRSSFRRNSQSQSKAEWATRIEFAVMSLDGDDYSSICLFVGTNLGRLVTFKLLPESHGGYAVKLAGSCSLDDGIISILPIDADSGEPAEASPELVAGLRSGSRVNGVLVAITRSGARIFKPVAAKGASKSWDDFLCHRAAVVRFETHIYALLGLFGDGCAKIFSIPGLKEIGSTNVSHTLDAQRFAEAVITPAGFIFGWTGPSEIVGLNVWGSGQDLTRSLDKIFNPEALIPPRPVISNMQWISGTQYVTPTDMDKLIGGPDRPPSKRMIEQMRADEEAQRAAARQEASSSKNPPPGRQEEGYWAYMQRQVQERTESLGLAGDNMDKLEDNSEGFAKDVNKFVSNQKKKAVMGSKS
ncbi:Lethal(2) giant larvae sro7 [Lecanora helva]